MEGAGLLGGIEAYHLRMLCENPWNGGAGYTPEQVGRMTLDQICFRLVDAKLLKRSGVHGSNMGPLEAVGRLKRGEDGLFRGRAADGTPIRGRIGGESKASMIRRKSIVDGGRRKRRER